MAISVALPQYRVWIDRPSDADQSFEVTRWCSGDSGGFLSVSTTPPDESGWVRYQGQLVLDVPQYNPAFDPWESDRWRVGSRVVIQVANSLGVLSELPWSRLYIVSEPLPPYPDNFKLNIELGCLATLRDGDKAAEVRQTQISRDAAAAGLWQQLGNPLTLQTGLPGLPLAKYEIALNSGIIEGLGNLAAGIGCYFWQDKTVVRPREILLEPPVRLFLHTVGVDDADDFEPLQSPLRPSGEVEVIGQGGATVATVDDNDPKYRGSITTIEKLSKAAIIEGESNQIITSAERTEAWNWINNTTFTQTVTESRVRAMVIPMDLYEQFGGIGAGPFDRLSDAYRSEQIDRYEAGNEGRKLSSRTEIYKPRGQVLADYYKKNLDPNQPTPNFSTPILAELTETEWRYEGNDPDDPGADTGGQVRRIKTTTWKTRGEIAADASNWSATNASPTTLVPALVREETWTRRSRIGEDDWSTTVKEWQSGRVRKGTIAAFTRLVLVKSETRHSRAGDIRPPAAERRPPAEGSAFSAGAIAPIPKGRVRFDRGDQRKRQIPLYWVESNAEAERIAELHGKLDHYRHTGFRIVTRLRDEWFNWVPLSRIDLDYNNKTYLGLTDIVTLTLAADQAIVVADCLRWATAVDPYPG